MYDRLSMTACLDCQGWGVVDGGECPLCRGTGQDPYPPDHVDEKIGD